MGANREMMLRLWGLHNLLPYQQLNVNASHMEIWFAVFSDQSLAYNSIFPGALHKLLLLQMLKQMLRQL
jgi:hypothetical protein